MDGSKLIGMVQAVEIVTNGYRPSAPTLTRWATRGVKGVRLQTTCMGGRRLTTIENVERFLADVDAVKNPQDKPERLACK